MHCHALAYVLSQLLRLETNFSPQQLLRWIVWLDPWSVLCEHVRPLGLMRGVISNSLSRLQVSKPHWENHNRCDCRRGHLVERVHVSSFRDRKFRDRSQVNRLMSATNNGSSTLRPHTTPSSRGALRLVLPTILLPKRNAKLPRRPVNASRCSWTGFITVRF